MLHIIAGAAVGFAIGLTGVGGGSLMTPLLLAFGYPASVAIGTDLIYAAVTKAGGVMVHHRRGNVDWRIVGLLAAGSLPVSMMLHAWVLSSQLQTSAGFEIILTRSLGGMLIITALVLILNNKSSQEVSKKPARPWQILLQRQRNLATLLMGMLLGVCVTFSSVGAGAFGAAILLTIYSETAAVRVIGTDIAHAVPLTFVAGMGYLFAGFVDGVLLVSLLIGSLPGIRLGSRVSDKVPELYLRRVLALILLALGAYYSLFAMAS